MPFGGISTVVYVDVLLFINTILTYAVLITAEKLFKYDAKAIRLVAASFVGALFTLTIFWEMNGRLLSAAIKAISSLAITYIAFSYIDIKTYIKNVLTVIGVSVVYSGFFILIYQFFKPPNLLIFNGVVYFEFNPLVLIGLTAVIYLIIGLFHKLFSERIKNTAVRLEFSVCGIRRSCIGKVDTGCNLTEPFSGDPVIIVDESLFCADDKQQKRVIPCRTVTSSSILYAVKADSVTIGKEPVRKEIYIASTGLNNNDFQAIINSDILR